MVYENTIIAAGRKIEALEALQDTLTSATGVSMEWDLDWGGWCVDDSDSAIFDAGTSYGLYLALSVVREILGDRKDVGAYESIIGSIIERGDRHREMLSDRSAEVGVDEDTITHPLDALMLLERWNSARREAQALCWEAKGLERDAAIVAAVLSDK